MKLLQLGFLGIALLVLIGNSVAQDFSILGPSTEIIETGFDNRSLAMGKTAITTARGSSAIFSNPSILATFSEPEVQIGGKLLYGTVADERITASERYDSYDARYPPFPNRSYLALAAPYQLPDTQLKLVLGVGYQRNEGVKTEKTSVRHREEWSETRGDIVNIRVTEERTDRRRGHLSTLTPGVALNFQDRYYLGATVNRTIGAIISTYETQSSDSNRKLDIEEEQSALFLRLGAFAELTPELSVGLMYRPEFDWEFGERILRLSEDGELDTERDTDRLELTMPTMWGIGVEYEASPELIVAAEVQYRPFSDLQWSGTADIVDPPIIDDGFNVAVGAEYLGFDYPMRIGAFRDLIPFVDENDTDPVHLIGITAGIGSIGEDEDFSWNVSALFARWERVNDEGQKYSEDLIRASISATYRFNVNLGSFRR
ncbi:hypothetical protein C6499_21755 [Candidatus Poribacteria bacterium]|nr:MAG: hypothetical protein C6499_21755 [Candidatus Poribacteria bacterium]